jgi:UDPglucose 6-dehydrogenase
VTAACVAASGIATVGVDTDAEVVAGLNRGEPPLVEPQLPELTGDGLRAGMLAFTTNLTALAAADVVWVCYDTPVDEHDRADVGSVTAGVEAIFPYLRDGAIVLVSSQLPVGSVAALERAVAKAVKGRTLDFACSPENLRLGRAIDSFRNPGRIVVGVRTERARAVLSELLGRFCANLIFTSVESAEMTKHALNAWLASSIALTNELAVICERVGADAAEVESGLRGDPRVGAHAYVRAGAAFAGGTLARDVRFLSQLAEQHHVKTPVIASVLASNEAHGVWSIDRLRERLGPLDGRSVAVLGLSYKPGTDAIRRSAALQLVRDLVAAHCAVRAFDPAVRRVPPDIGGDLVLAQDVRQAMHGADAVVIATEWPQFRSLTAEDFTSSMSGNLILDPGRFLSPAIAADPRLTLLSVGRAA